MGGAHAVLPAVGALAVDKGMGDLIRCACQCGGTLRAYDDRKRPREYLPGHNIRVEWSKRK